MIQMIANGSLVRCKNTQRIGLVMSIPEEKPVQMSPNVMALVMVVDVLWNEEGFEYEIPTTRLERVDRNIRR